MQFSDLSPTNAEHYLTMSNPLFTSVDKRQLSSCLLSYYNSNEITALDGCLLSQFWNEFAMGFVYSLLEDDVSPLHISQNTIDCTYSHPTINKFLECPSLLDKTERTKGYILAYVLRLNLIPNKIDFKSPTSYLKSHNIKYSKPKLFSHIRR